MSVLKTRGEILKWLALHNIRGCNIGEDLSIDVDGNVNLSNKSLLVIPVRFRNVNGDFHCNKNNLSTLEGRLSD